MIRLPDGRKVDISGTPPINTKAAAEAAERALIEETLNPRPKPKPEPTREEVPRLKDFRDRFLAMPTKYGKPSGIETRKTIMDLHLIPFFGEMQLDKIRFGQLQDFAAAQVEKGLAQKTINNHLSVLHRALVMAKKRELIENVPEFPWYKIADGDFDFLTFDEAERLIREGDDEWQAMILLAAKTGLRQGELLGLWWEDVDLVAGRLLVKRALVRGVMVAPKSFKAREVALSDEALAALKSHRHLRGPHVFCDLDGAPLTKGACKHPLWRACKRAGLRRIGWHVMRHTFASHLAMRGVPLKAIQELLGHATIEMTMRYAHLSPDVKRDAVKLLDASSPAPLQPRSNSQGQQLKQAN